MSLCRRILLVLVKHILCQLCWKYVYNIDVAFKTYEHVFSTQAILQFPILKPRCQNIYNETHFLCGFYTTPCIIRGCPNVSLMLCSVSKHLFTPPCIECNVGRWVREESLKVKVTVDFVSLYLFLRSRSLLVLHFGVTKKGYSSPFKLRTIDNMLIPFGTTPQLHLDTFHLNLLSAFASPKALKLCLRSRPALKAKRHKPRNNFDIAPEDGYKHSDLVGDVKAPFKISANAAGPCSIPKICEWGGAFSCC